MRFMDDFAFDFSTGRLPVYSDRTFAILGSPGCLQEGGHGTGGTQGN